MPISHTINVLLGAALLGVMSAAGMYLVEHYRQDRKRHAMLQEMDRLNQELSLVKKDVQQLLALREEQTKKTRRSILLKANSMVSTNSTTDECFSARDLDSSDLEFYDVSDDEVDKGFDNILGGIDRKLEEGTLSELQNILEKLEDLHKEHPVNPEVLWRIGKAHHKIGDKCDNNETTKDHVYKGIDSCKLALQLNPENSEIHKWFAILIGARSDFQSLQGRISDGHLFKSHIDAALSINPKDPTLHHLLGRFNFEVAGLKWYERKAAAAIFSEPPSATYAEALEHFIQADALAKFDWKENQLMIAKCKIATRDYKEAVEWLEKANICKDGDGLDDKIDSEVRALLQEYNSYR